MRASRDRVDPDPPAEAQAARGPATDEDPAADELAFDVVGSGPGPTVVLVHGAPDRAGSFRDVLAHLDGRRVVLYDRRGYGRSRQVRAPTGLVDHAEDLIRVVERVGEPCVVVGHSFGSNPTMLAAAHRPDAFAALGLWEPPTVWVDWWRQSVKDYHAAVAACDDAADAVEVMYRRILGNKVWFGLPPEVRQERRDEGRAFQVDMASVLAAPFAFAEVTVPAVVGYGATTSAEHVHGAEWLAEHLPDARLHVVPEAGHFANRTHPEAFARFVGAAVDRARTPDGGRQLGT